MPNVAMPWLIFGVKSDCLKFIECMPDGWADSAIRGEGQRQITYPHPAQICYT
ncbi:hypothetical protein FHW16_003745 [Phyllobacterium myrsinacearum]|uniref:Uncharacterized protein n=1 Tax=Phyllobacterium myrsinacearum TaxID=28101 RepID=A0A839ERN2_9HYPH|nr:hypothetical protein [Phyllobacterium myrsinacearum]